MADTKFHTPGAPVECALDCKALFHRPQDASPALSTQAVAQLHGWRTIDREGEMLICPMHAERMG
jgi:hypothetical protein